LGKVFIDFDYDLDEIRPSHYPAVRAEADAGSSALLRCFIATWARLQPFSTRHKSTCCALAMGPMPVEWLSFSKLIPAGWSAVKSIYDRVIGKSPRLNFEPDSGGIELHIFNTRDQTIIIEGIEASPPLLGFSAGGETIDIVRAAVVVQRGHRDQPPIAVVSPGDKASVMVITVDPFEIAEQHQTIKVRMYWRTATRKSFSRSSVTSKISVQDIKDLKTAADRKQPRIFSV